MKATLTAMALFALATVFAVPSRSFAQASDTLRLYANPISGPTFDQVIMGDTTATGQRKDPNRVYLLQQTGSVDTVYYYDNSMITNFNVTIIGKRNPITGMPPVICPNVLPDGSAPGNLMAPRGTGNVIILKDLYILGETFNGQHFLGNIINESGDSTTIIYDHDVIDNCAPNLAYMQGKWCNFYMKNCEFRNASNQFWQSGGCVWGYGAAPLDTVSIVNNTFFGMGRHVIGGPGYVKYFNYNHNTNFLGTGGLFIMTAGLADANFTNNIFYGVEAHGADSAYVLRGLANYAHQPFGVIMVDSMGAIGPQYGITEAQRHITVENNAYCWPKQLYTFWNSVNDTAPGLLFPPEWMNPQTDSMFNNKTAWPYLIQANNDSVDPGFSSTMVNSMTDSLVKFIGLIGYPPGNAGTFRWWYLPTNPNPAYVFNQFPKNWGGWSTGYPVPENLAYSNTALQSAGTDGFALGDLNWYPSQLRAFDSLATPVLTRPKVATKFALSQNYPNPFNPTTEIRVTLQHAGSMSLKVYDVLGQLVDVVAEGYRPAGEYLFNVNMDRFASGVYFYTLRQGASSITKKMVLLK